jgi:hypothetical protein
LKIIPDKTEYSKRDKIKLELIFPEDSKAIVANLSISVFEDLPGDDINLSLRNYLSTKPGNSGSRKFTNIENGRFLPEEKGEIISGWVINQLSGIAVANSCVFLSAEDSVVNLQYNFSDLNGFFRFLLKDYYFGKDIVFSVKDNAPNKKLKIELEDKFEIKNNYLPINYEANLALKDYILKSQDIVNIQKIYDAVYKAEIKKQFKSSIICPRLYYKPYYSVKPSDFIPLVDFIDITREILPPQLRLSKQNTRYYANMADENQHLFLNEEPVIFLDGVLIDNINQIIQLGSDKIKMVDLICTRYNYGNLIFPGILAVYSSSKEIKNIQPFDNSIRLQLEKFHPYSVFTTRMHSGDSSAVNPDFRQLLYWNPNIDISQNHTQVPEFYASDHSGNYFIMVEGISSDGVPISVTTKIKVKQ